VVYIPAQSVQNGRGFTQNSRGQPDTGFLFSLPRAHAGAEEEEELYLRLETRERRHNSAAEPVAVFQENVRLVLRARRGAAGAWDKTLSVSSSLSAHCFEKDQRSGPIVPGAEREGEGGDWRLFLAGTCERKKSSPGPKFITGTAEIRHRDCHFLLPPLQIRIRDRPKFDTDLNNKAMSRWDTTPASYEFQ
jgi:hypothetical protein